MQDDNKHNLVYFEHPTMRGLYETMDAWQVEHQKRLLSVSVQRDGDNYCCIALTNPSEVIIVSAPTLLHGAVVTAGYLQVATRG